MCEKYVCESGIDFTIIRTGPFLLFYIRCHQISCIDKNLAASTKSLNGRLSTVVTCFERDLPNGTYYFLCKQRASRLTFATHMQHTHYMDIALLLYNFMHPGLCEISKVQKGLKGRTVEGLFDEEVGRSLLFVERLLKLNMRVNRTFS